MVQQQNMNNQFQRETNQEDPENIHSNNFHIRQQPDNKIQLKDQNSYKILQGGSFENGSGQQTFEKALLESQDVLKKIDLFNSLADKTQVDYAVMEQLFATHIRTNIHPNACSDAGDFLLRNGKFIICFIEIVTRKQKNLYLKKYLLNYFSELNKITKQKQLFLQKVEQIKQMQQEELHKQKGKQNKSEKRQNKQQRRPKLLMLSPESSKNEGNWSTKVEQDTNSPFKYSVFDSENNNKKSDQKLKRSRKQLPKQINQSQQKSDKATKNTRKSLKRSQKKTKQKTAEHKQSQRKSNKQQKRTLTKSTGKEQHNNSSKKHMSSKKKTIDKDHRIQDDIFGSCYHYEVSLNPKNLKKELKQIRTSARLSKKKDRVSQSLRISNSHGKSSKSKQKKQRQKSVSKRKNRNGKKTRKRNQQVEQRTPSQGSNFSEDFQLEIEWVKNHLKQLDIHNVQLYSDFTALTKNDQKITKLLRQMQNSQEASQAFSFQPKKEKRESEVDQGGQKDIDQIQDIDQTQTRVISRQKKSENQGQKLKNFSQMKKQFQIEQLPLTIDQVVDPDINGHGIYALLRLGRISELEMGTGYAVSPLTYGVRVNKRHIKQDIEKAKELAGKYGQNIGYIPTSQQILEMIEKKKKQIKQLRVNTIETNTDMNRDRDRDIVTDIVTDRSK